MRPRTFSYTLAALDADGYLNDATGAGPFTSILAQPPDGLAHPVTLASAANLSTITFTINGTDADGVTISETIAGPVANTVTSTKLFKTVTSIVNSATLGANTMDAGWTAVAESQVFPVDRFSDAGVMVVADIDGTIAYTVQQTNSNVFDGSTVHWALLGSAGATADQVAQALIGATAVRFTIASHTSGTIAFGVAQRSY